MMSDISIEQRQESEIHSRVGTQESARMTEALSTWRGFSMVKSQEPILWSKMFLAGTLIVKLNKTLKRITRTTLTI